MYYLPLTLSLKAVASSGTSSTAYTGVWQSIVKIFREESLLSFWKGNGTNVIRIFPYSAAQLMANDQYKRLLVNAEGELTVTIEISIRLIKVLGSKKISLWSISWDDCNHSNTSFGHCQTETSTPDTSLFRSGNRSKLT